MGLESAEIIAYADDVTRELLTKFNKMINWSLGLHNKI